MLSVDEIKESLEALDINTVDEDAIMQNCDFNHDGRITFSEFVAVTRDQKMLIND